MRTFLSLILVSFSAVFSFAQHHHGQVDSPIAPHPHLSESLQYVQNKGQWEPSVRFRAGFTGARMFLQEDGVLWAKLENGASTTYHDHKMDPEKDERTLSFQAHAWKIHFLGGQKPESITGGEKAEHYHNYFLGNDPSKWAGNVPVFAEVLYTEIWPGVDIRFHSANSNVKYDVLLDPGAKAGSVGLLYEGVNDIALNAKGELVIQTSVGVLQEMSPIAWYADNKEPISCEFTLNGNTVGFSFPKGRDLSRAIVIDPVLIGATYSGMLGDDIYGHCATYDNSGNIYSGGQIFGPGLPTSVGAYQATFGGGFGTDINVNKFSPDASLQIYATYIGSSEDEKPHSMIVNSAQELIVFGSSAGAGYPTTASAVYPTSFGGGRDIVVSRFNSSGTALLGSTYFGGSGIDGTQNIFVNYGDAYRGEVFLDINENIFITSSTTSSDFPVSAGAFQSTLGGQQDAVVFGLTPDMSSVLWSTYLGGSSDDNGLGMRFAANGDAIVVGTTSSTDFPNMGNGAQNANAGGNDGYVARLSNNGTTLFSQTFFGTTGNDGINFVDLDRNDDIYVYGQTDQNIPITPAGTYGQANGSIFINKFDGSLNSTLITSTLGPPGATSLAPVAFLVDVCDQIYISGYNPSTGWATTPNALYSTSTFSDFYLAVYDINMTSLRFGTFYGGSHVDGGTSRFDKNGIVYQGVCSGGNSMPTSVGSYAPNNNVAWDVGVFKIDMEQAGVQVNMNINSPNVGCAPSTFTFNALGSANTYNWDMDDGSPLITNTTTVTHTYTNPGIYQVILIGIDSLTCNIADTALYTVYVNGPGSLDPGFTAIPTSNCTTLAVTLTDTTAGAGFVTVWDLGDGTNATGQFVNHSYVNGGTYNITMTVIDTICGDTAISSAPITLNPGTLTFDLGNDLTICNGQSVNVSAPIAGATYLWNTGASTQTITIDQAGSYWVDIDQNGCEGSDTIQVTFVNPPVALGSTRSTCPGDSALLVIPMDSATYSWLGNGANTQSITVGLPGAYIFQVTDAAGCTYQDTAFVEQASDLVDVDIPNVFSPNGDGFNDRFEPIAVGNGDIDVEIYNRWGQMMFSDSGLKRFWDGKYNSNPCPDGTYYYIVTYSSECRDEITDETGHVTLVR